MTPTRPRGFLSGSTLKLLACALMLVDHIGFILFPRLTVLRQIGRLAFPLFAFFIAEGCRYTRNRTRRLLWLAVPAAVMALVCFLYDGKWLGNIFVTFTYAVALIYLLDAVRTQATRAVWRGVAAGGVFLAALAAVWWLCEVLPVDYGYYGVLAPVFVYAADMLSPRDSHLIRLGGLAIGLALISHDLGSYQYYSFLALIPLALYNGERGRYPLKYFFYLFYPLHLAALQLIDTLLKNA